MPTAKEPLKIGFTIAVPTGAYVSQEDVDKYGWKDQVEKGGHAPKAHKDKDADSK
jgi:hypothetical protein